MRRWRVWDLDSELRYAPVVARLPRSALPICEVGSGAAGLAGWTTRQVIGVDPGDDTRHGPTSTPPNLRRVIGDGAHIPLPDKSVCAAVAVDTFEHIPQHARAAVVAEMKRVTADGGRVILMGPTGSAAAAGDRKVLARWLEIDPDCNIAVWLTEHEEIGLPDRGELGALLAGDRTSSVRAIGVYNLKLWWTVHRVLLGDFPHQLNHDRVHPIAWAPLGFIARRYRRGLFYRWLFVADISA